MTYLKIQKSSRTEWTDLAALMENCPEGEAFEYVLPETAKDARLRIRVYELAKTKNCKFTVNRVKATGRYLIGRLSPASVGIESETLALFKSAATFAQSLISASAHISDEHAQSWVLKSAVTHFCEVIGKLATLQQNEKIKQQCENLKLQFLDKMPISFLSSYAESILLEIEND